MTKNNLSIFPVSGWIFCSIVFIIGILNVVLVHPVPGIVYLLLSFIYLPPANDWLRMKFGFTIPMAVKIVLGIVIIWFTLGISDLGDMID